MKLLLTTLATSLVHLAAQSAVADIPLTPDVVFRSQSFDASPASEAPAVVHTVASGDLIPVSNSGHVSFPAESATWSAVAPYAWGTAAKGTITIRGMPTSFDLSLSDLVDLLKEGDVRGAGMLHVETGKDQFGFMVDGAVASIAVSQPVNPLVTADVQFDLTVLEAIGIFRVADSSGEDFEGVPIVLDLLGGIRYYDVGSELRFTIGSFVTPDLGQSNNWIDLLTGFRARVALTEALTGSFRFDVAGFGLGTSSDTTFNLTAGVEYDCPDFEGLSLFAGYRYLDIDEDHSAGTPDAFGFDASLHGPVLGFVFRF